MKAPVLISFSVMLCGSSLFGIERPKSLDSDKPRVPAEQVDNGIKEGGAEGAPDVIDIRNQIAWVGMKLKTLGSSF